MTYLILSDIHANLEALEAVLTRAEGRYTSILALGDLVGYGADPNAVLEWASANVAAAVRGNHDVACAGDSVRNFNAAAAAAVLWTRRQMTPDNAAYLRALPRGPLHVGGITSRGCDLCHGSPRDENEYLCFPDRSLLPDLQSQVTFVGHTHQQGGFRFPPNAECSVIHGYSERSLKLTGNGLPESLAARLSEGR